MGTAKHLTNRKAFNETLEHLISNRPRHYLLDIIDVMEDGSLVDSMNHLNGYGRVCYFDEIDRTLEKFDKCRVSLKPNQGNSLQKVCPRFPGTSKKFKNRH